MRHTPTTILLTGRPGSGKGTQAKLLADGFGWQHFSTGNIFKELRDGEGVLSERVREAYDAGKLLPDWFATYLFEDTMLKLPLGHTIICEGYPRSRPQAEIFDEITAWLNRSYQVLDLVVSKEEALRRMNKRSLIEHRPDSSEEVLAARLALYEDTTAPVLDFFRERGALIEIDGELTPEGVAASIREHLSLEK